MPRGAGWGLLRPGTFTAERVTEAPPGRKTGALSDDSLYRICGTHSRLIPDFTSIYYISLIAPAKAQVGLTVVILRRGVLYSRFNEKGGAAVAESKANN